MIKISEVIIVEGRYDKNAVRQLVDGTVIETGGFGVFSDKEKLELIRRMAEKRGIIILTDSDGAGFMIRNYLKGAVDPSRVKHAYVPDVFGKEKRKKFPSKEGKIGVEGMDIKVLEEVLLRAGATVSEPFVFEPRVTKADFFALGLSGTKDSAVRRSALKKRLGLPEGLSSNALLDVINALMGRVEFLRLEF